MFSYYFNSRELKTAVNKLFADNAHRQYGAAVSSTESTVNSFLFIQMTPS